MPTKEQQAKWNRTWYEKNSEKRKAITNRQRQEARDFIRSCKDVPCERCGIKWHPAAMDFHHKDSTQKESEISTSVRKGWSIKRIRAEIAKCEIICSNCHRTEHALNG